MQSGQREASPTCRHPRTPKPPPSDRQPKSVGDVISLQALSPESRSSCGDVVRLLLLWAERTWPQRDSRDTERQDRIQKWEGRWGQAQGVFRALNKQPALETAEGENLDSDHLRTWVRRCGPASDRGHRGTSKLAAGNGKGVTALPEEGSALGKARMTSPKKAADVRPTHAAHATHTGGPFKETSQCGFFQKAEQSLRVT